MELTASQAQVIHDLLHKHLAADHPVAAMLPELQEAIGNVQETGDEYELPILIIPDGEADEPDVDETAAGPEGDAAPERGR